MTLISFTFICWHGLPYILNSVQLSVTLPVPVTTDRASVRPKWIGKKIFCWRSTLGFSDEVFCKRLIAISLPLNEMLSSFHALWGGESFKRGIGSISRTIHFLRLPILRDPFLHKAFCNWKRIEGVIELTEMSTRQRLVCHMITRHLGSVFPLFC